MLGAAPTLPGRARGHRGLADRGPWQASPRRDALGSGPGLDLAAQSEAASSNLDLVTPTTSQNPEALGTQALEGQEDSGAGGARHDEPLTNYDRRAPSPSPDEGGARYVARATRQHQRTPRGTQRTQTTGRMPRGCRGRHARTRAARGRGADSRREAQQQGEEQQQEGDGSPRVVGDSTGAAGKVGDPGRSGANDTGKPGTWGA